MMRLIRGKFWWPLVSLFAVVSCLGAEQSTDDFPDPYEELYLEDDEALASLMKEALPRWQWSAYVRTAIVYTDNALLSSVNPLGDDFLRTELDFFLWKLPTEGGDGYLYVNGVDVRFDDLEGADKEQVWMGNLRWNQYFGTSNTAYVDLLYMYQDQVIDFSESLFYSYREQVRSHRYGPTIGWIGQLGERNELDLSIKLHREEYQELLDNQWKPGAELEWTFKPWEHWEWGSRLSWERRLHDDRYARDAQANAIDGLIEEAEQMKALFILKHPVWPGLDARMSWELGETRQRDNGEGFLDFDRKQAQFYLDGRWRGWEVLVGAGWSETSYALQHESLWDPSLRLKRDRYLNMEVSHALSSRGRIFAACEFNETIGNFESDNFSDMRMYVGLQVNVETLFGNDASL